VLSVGISVLITAASASLEAPPLGVTAIVAPLQFTMLVAGILGAIVVTGEYATGMIRSTLTAEPRRGAVVAAKAIVISVLMALTTVVSYILAILATAPLTTEGLDWSTPEQSIVPLGYGVLSMVSFTLLGVGFGFIVRNGAGAIAATVGILFVLPIVFSLFNIGGEAWRWLVDLQAYLPMNASADLTTPGSDTVLASAVTLVAWMVVPLVAGWAVLRTRDA
jgi:ABC-2 type transport system permease protein